MRHFSRFLPAAGLLLCFLIASGAPGEEEGLFRQDPGVKGEADRMRMMVLRRAERIRFARLDTGEVDFRDYDLRVRLHPARHFLEEEAVVVFRSRVPQLSEVGFVLYDDTLAIRSVTCGRDTLSWTYEDTLWVLHVRLRDTLGLGEEDTLRIVYSGYITPELSRSLDYACLLDSNLAFCTYAPFVWYPAPYDYFYSSRVDDRASGTVRLTVPKGYLAVSSGALIDSTATDTTQTFAWSTTNPVMEFNFACAPYAMASRPYSGIALRYYDLDTTGAGYTFTAAGSVLDFFSRAFTPYDFEKLAFANQYQPYGYGGYTLVIMPLPGDLSFLAHETAHEWWGHVVGLRFLEEVWLNEGFASYSDALFQEDSLGRQELRYQMDSWGSWYLSIPPSEDEPIVPAPWSSNHYYEIVYLKGAWVLHMLRGVVGDSAYFDLMKAYASTYQDSSATVALFRQVAEQRSGRGLGWFFDEWLYHTGAPRYTYAWQSRQIGVDTFQLTLRVNQLDSLFTMPIQTSIFTPGGSQEQWPLVAHRSDTFQFILSQAPDSVLLDKDNWLLDRGITRVGVEAGTLSVPFTTILFPVHPNPFRGSARIEYSLAAKGRVRLSVYNVSGQLVRELVDMVQPPGRYSVSWDGRDWEAHRLPGGVYFCRIQTETFSDTKKAVVVR
jgi:aminopeptidase N